jgi:hypothetical protein
MVIEFRGQYDKKLFFQAVRLANRPARNQQRYVFIMTTFAIVAIGIMIYRVIQTGDLMGNVILLGGALVLVGIVGWIHLTPYFTAQKMWTNPGTRRELKGQVTNQGITYLLEAGVNEIRWEHFSRVRKNQDTVTLVRNDGLLVIFPRRFFRKDADWRKFTKLIENKGFKSSS